MASSDFRALCNSLDPPLWVVTAAAGRDSGGLLATFVSPASITGDCPRILAGIGKSHRTWELIEASGGFAVHLLTMSQEHLDWADRFGLESGRTVDKFGGLRSRQGQTGSPILEDAAAWAECKVEARFDTGDRTIYLAEVVDAKPPESAEILTVQRWVKTLSTLRQARQSEQFSANSTLDAEAILTWRARIKCV